MSGFFIQKNNKIIISETEKNQKNVKNSVLK